MHACERLNKNILRRSDGNINVIPSLKLTATPRGTSSGQRISRVRKASVASGKQCPSKKDWGGLRNPFQS